MKSFSEQAGFYLLKVKPSAPSIPSMLHRVSLHMLFWIGLFLLTRYQAVRIFSRTASNPDGINFMSVSHIALLMASFYGLSFLLLPKFRYQVKHIGWALIGTLLLYWVLVCCFTWWDFDFVVSHFPPTPFFYKMTVNEFEKHGFWGFFMNPTIILFVWAQNISYLTIPLMFKGIRDTIRFSERTIKLERDKYQLENDKVVLELSFLRSQINPHFLFNALNNLYGLFKKRDAKAEDTLFSLSSMMRYSLYETQRDLVLLSDELSFVEQYVKLERLRHRDRSCITLAVSGATHDDYQIPPLTLITFIENAFKHGLNACPIGGWVRVDIVINEAEDKLYFRVANNKPTNRLSEAPGASGLGLGNVRKRLDLLYPSGYDLYVDDQETVYSVSLTISLHGNSINNQPTASLSYR